MSYTKGQVDRGPGQPWRPGIPAPAPIDAGTPSEDIRIGYARCSTLTHDLRTQLDALAARNIPRDKIFAEKISTAPVCGSAPSPRKRCAPPGK
ncbi:hypothetical protein [Streptomyces sp. NPDC007905]|uniref:hypothetical protein n=1 Tax=Streptomyces sp. NPDC007905 TaxID=3364788 RepID=UPI0036EC8AFC